MIAKAREIYAFTRFWIKRHVVESCLIATTLILAMIKVVR